MKSWDAPEEEVSKISTDSLLGIYIYKVSLSDYENDYYIIFYGDGITYICFNGKSQVAFGFGLEIPNSMSDMLLLNFKSFRGVEELFFIGWNFKNLLSSFFVSFNIGYLWL